MPFTINVSLLEMKTKIHNSIFGDKCHIADNCHIEASIFEDGVVIGSGVKVENNCVIGSKVHIPANTIVESGSILRIEAPDEKLQENHNENAYSWRISAEPTNGKY